MRSSQKEIMKSNRKNDFRKAMAGCLTGAAVLMMTACGNKSDFNLVESEEGEERVVNLYSPMEKMSPDAENVARNAADKTIIMAEEELGVNVGYITYTAEDYQD